MREYKEKANTSNKKGYVILALKNETYDNNRHCSYDHEDGYLSSNFDHSINSNVLKRLSSNIPFNFANIQTKLKISEPDDIYEKEADEIADAVVENEFNPFKPNPTRKSSHMINRQPSTKDDEQDRRPSVSEGSTQDFVTKFIKYLAMKFVESKYGKQVYDENRTFISLALSSAAAGLDFPELTKHFIDLSKGSKSGDSSPYPSHVSNVDEALKEKDLTPWMISVKGEWDFHPFLMRFSKLVTPTLGDVPPDLSSATSTNKASVVRYDQIRRGVFLLNKSPVPNFDEASLLAWVQIQMNNFMESEFQSSTQILKPKWFGTWRPNVLFKLKDPSIKTRGDLLDVNESSNSPGFQMDPTTLSFMESRFGYDFSNVRIHADDKASKLAEISNARAYTVSNNIVFGLGQYNPNTTTGQRLLAHELVHVMQQNITKPTDPLSKATNNVCLQRAGRKDGCATEAHIPRLNFIYFRTSGESKPPASNLI